MPISNLPNEILHTLLIYFILTRGIFGRTNVY